MKFIAVILSVYIMVLTAMPCNDVHAANNTNSLSIEITNQSPNQTNDVDLCSPFCFCQCCQVLSFPSFFSLSAVNFEVKSLNVTIKASAYTSPVASIWQPPEI